MIITAALLERNDLFVLGSNGTVVYRVKNIGGGYVNYEANSGTGTAKHKIGINSKQRLTLLNDGDFGDPTKLYKYMNILVPEEKYLILAD